MKKIGKLKLLENYFGADRASFYDLGATIEAAQDFWVAKYTWAQVKRALLKTCPEWLEDYKELELMIMLEKSQDAAKEYFDQLFETHLKRSK